MTAFDPSQRIGTLSGMALIVLMQIDSSEVLKTMLLAGIGGASSYLCTLAVRVLLSRIRKKKQ